MNSSTGPNVHEFKTFSFKSSHNAYDNIDDIHSNERKICFLSMTYLSNVWILEHSSSSSSSNHIRDSGYETTSSNLEQQQQQRFHRPLGPSNVSLSPDGQLITVTYFSSPIPSHHDSSLSPPTIIPRTLKTFSQMPVTNPPGNELSLAINTHLAEQEIIEV